MNKLNMTETAKKDMHQIKQYITEKLQNPQAALSTVTKIAKSIRMLRKYPQIGPLLSSIADGQEEPYRFLVSGSYLIFYHICRNEVVVDRVLYGRSDYMETLFGEASDQETEAPEETPE